MTQQETLILIKDYMKKHSENDHCKTAKDMIKNIEKHYNQKISAATVSRLQVKGYRLHIPKGKSHLVLQQRQNPSPYDIAHDVPYVTIFKTLDNTLELQAHIKRLAKQFHGEVFSIIQDNDNNLIIYSSVYNFAQILNKELCTPKNPNAKKITAPSMNPLKP